MSITQTKTKRSYNKKQQKNQTSILNQATPDQTQAAEPVRNQPVPILTQAPVLTQASSLNSPAPCENIETNFEETEESSVRLLGNARYQKNVIDEALLVIDHSFEDDDSLPDLRKKREESSKPGVNTSSEHQADVLIANSINKYFASFNTQIENAVSNYFSKFQQNSSSRSLTPPTTASNSMDVCENFDTFDESTPLNPAQPSSRIRSRSRSMSRISSKSRSNSRRSISMSRNNNSARNRSSSRGRISSRHRNRSNSRRSNSRHRNRSNSQRSNSRHRNRSNSRMSSSRHRNRSKNRSNRTRRSMSRSRSPHERRTTITTEQIEQLRANSSSDLNFAVQLMLYFFLNAS